MNALNGPLADLADVVRADLTAFFGALDLTAPAAARDALTDYVPLLVGEYGESAAAIACDWYEDVRLAAGAAGTFRARPADTYPAEAVERRVRSAAGPLFDGAPDVTLATLLTAVDKFVKQPARDSIVSNGQRDRWRPRFARVPRGATTCGFCVMLASRGAVYLNQETAGEFTKFHGSCDCQIVTIGPHDELPEGYHPDAMYGDYKAARAIVGEDYPDTRDIVRELNRLLLSRQQ